MAEQSFKDRHVVVTGGTGALGGTVIERLLAGGATCHVPNSHAKPPKDFAFAGNKRVMVVDDVDLTDAAKVDAFYAGLPSLWASIHVAGGFSFGKIDEASVDDFDRMISGNARTTWLCCRAAVIAMRKAGTAGRIVNVAARQALDPRKGSGTVAYTASKAAVAAITVALAEEVKGAGILVNAVAPSTMDTAANRKDMPDADFSKWVSLEAAAEAICHLASPENLIVSGAVVPIYARA